MAGAGMRLAKRYCGKKGAAQPGRELQHLIFGSYNRRIDNPRSGNDWLTRDAEAVACLDRRQRVRLPADQPGIFTICLPACGRCPPEMGGPGAQDPPHPDSCRGGGPGWKLWKGAEEGGKTLTDAGVQDVGLKLYPRRQA